MWLFSCSLTWVGDVCIWVSQTVCLLQNVNIERDCEMNGFIFLSVWNIGMLSHPIKNRHCFLFVVSHQFPVQISR